VAAALAITYCLRCGVLEPLEYWPRELADRYEWLPDGPVLWAETLLRRMEEDGACLKAQLAGNQSSMLNHAFLREALDFFSRIADRGVPLLAHSLAMARRRAAFWRRLLASGSLGLMNELRLASALERIERANSYALTGGSFARFVSVDGEMGPNRIWPIS
jgi:hypothetical protein